MTIGNLIRKQQEIKTPSAIKVTVILQFFFMLGAINRILYIPFSLSTTSLFSSFLVLGEMAIQTFSLIAIWNLRKWGLYAYTIMVIIGLAVADHSMAVMSNPRVLLFIIIIRGSVIAAALHHRDLMT